MPKRSHKHAFTLIELLTVVAITAILAAIAFPVCATGIRHAQCSACASNMRGLGIAFMSYAYDNGGFLPQRVVSGNKWPTLLLPYVSYETSIYVDPGDPVATKIPASQLISNSPNNSSFIFNGFNDQGALGNPNVVVNISSIPSPSTTLLLGQQKAAGNNFYLDVNEGDQNTVLNKKAYFGGANYVFADGSCRFMNATTYNDAMWLVNPNYAIPSP
jgi:prepilin-type N-terminal cleavage/methylation domain-containing protein/prepilin-type processing-associated H-X9-DG protein